jgi:hypothetical protein
MMKIYHTDESESIEQKFNASLQVRLAGDWANGLPPGKCDYPQLKGLNLASKFQGT